MEDQKIYFVINRINSYIFRKAYRNHLSNPQKIHPNYPCPVIFGEGSQINLNANLILNENCENRYRHASYLRMDANSQLEVMGDFKFYFDADIILFKGARLTLGNSFINRSCKIRCGNHITIGDDCVISHDVTIMDSDFHSIIAPDYKVSEPVEIQDHVWIGTRCVILKGVTIGKGAIVAAGSIVTHEVPPRSLVGGNPAKVIRTDVDWRK